MDDHANVAVGHFKNKIFKKRVLIVCTHILPKKMLRKPKNADKWTLNILQTLQSI